MKGSKEETVRRYVMFLVGLAVMALAVAVMAKAKLGISPVQSAAYVVYNAFPEVLTLGTVVFSWNCIQVLLQWPLLGKKFGWKQLVQVPMSLFLGVLVDAAGLLLEWLQPVDLLWQILTVLAGIVILDISICIIVSAGAVMNAGEALVSEAARVLKKPFGSVKEIFDISIIAIGILLSFVFFGKWRFDIIGIGTLLSALITGFLVKWLNKRIGPAIERFCSGK